MTIDLQAILNSAWLRGGVILLLSFLSYIVTKKILIKAVHKVAAKTSSNLDDMLVKEKVFSAIALVLPGIVINYGAQTFPFIKDSYLSNTLSAYFTVVFLLVVNRFLNACVAIYNHYPVASRRPIKGYVQLVKIFVTILGVLFLISLAVGVSPWKLLSGIGALTAVLMLIFRDTILSLVASIQIAGNDLLRKGDWIEMPQFGADGDVLDIALHIVQIQNFDKTIVSIPTSKFLDHSFKNWRGMQDARGRRIKRALFIDQSSIRFLDDAMIQELSKIDLLKEYIATKTKDIEEYNKTKSIDPDVVVNGRRMTNIGTFRAYVLNYLKEHPAIRQDLTLLVRQLQPKSSEGLPLEIYCFTNTTNWSAYEDIQSDIFDHILAALPLFKLKSYQRNALVDSRS